MAAPTKRTSKSRLGASLMLFNASIQTNNNNCTTRMFWLVTAGKGRGTSSTHGKFHTESKNSGDCSWFLLRYIE